ncbi:serine protease 27-like isoform X2 [Lissotriton helveticus]
MGSLGPNSSYMGPINISVYTVRMGAYALYIPTSSEIISALKQIIVNSNYSSATGSAGDIALVQLQTPVAYSDFILPVLIPSASLQIPDGMMCWVTGWGTINQNGDTLPYPWYLQEVSVPIVPTATCKTSYSDILYDMICAGYTVGGKDACQGDSGGPLVCKFTNAWILVGIVSWGSGCAQANYPGVYTRVSVYINWITQNAPGINASTVNTTTYGVPQSITTHVGSTTTVASKNNSWVPRASFLFHVLHCALWFAAVFYFTS